MATFHAASATDVGNARATNQDACYAAERLCIVADGMGGHAGGEVAAASAVSGLIKAFSETPNAKGLLAGAKSVNREIYDRAEESEELRGMGTTLVAMALVPHRNAEKIALINVGDSRAYLFEEDELVRLTEDHSLVEELLRQGEITQAEADVHPYRHVLTRAVGIDDRVETDSWTLDPVVGTRLLLCSDGLTNECTEEIICEILSANSEPADAAYALIRRALDHGGNDNITVVVADVVGGGTSSGKSQAGSIGQTGDLAVAPVPLESETPALAPSSIEQSGLTEPTSSASSVAMTLSQRAQDTLTAIPIAKRPRRPKAVRAPRASETLHTSLAEQIITFRVALVAFLLLLIIAGTAGSVVWFNKATYFIGIDSRQHVAIYNGRPNGFLWFKPTLVHESTLVVSKVLPANLPLLQQGMLESSYSQALTVVHNLTSELGIIAAATSKDSKGATSG